MVSDKAQKTLYYVGCIMTVLIGITIGGLSVSVWAEPFNKAKDTTRTIANPFRDTTNTVILTSALRDCLVESGLVDTLAINTAFLNKMREKGELLSSDEFASRITGYYNTLVAVLTALFVLFTIVTYATIKSKFEAKFEDKARELENKQRQKIIDELRNMLNDSKRFDEVINSTIGGRLEDLLPTKEEVDDIASVTESNRRSILSLSMNLDVVKKKMEELFEVVQEIQDQVSGKSVVFAEDKEEVADKLDTDSDNS